MNSSSSVSSPLCQRRGWKCAASQAVLKCGFFVRNKASPRAGSVLGLNSHIIWQLGWEAGWWVSPTVLVFGSPISEQVGALLGWTGHLGSLNTWVSSPMKCGGCQRGAGRINAMFVKHGERWERVGRCYCRDP